ncbi:hypothetical protein BU26DRAFT_142883 [Trematosphaeria pertusa]|uniref:Uncharacterized protein n=1 Tax=Trematosphaeria pertusa TaxID=390896 RepID=A0A6A6IW30_9PLEO|nr:uncharacterized protein BU26DRAFT_142883 [Trematosphaeria pertusa]KAF2254649.1 hypothetical protein BU26DRAFT_142883 [Trematosphaeria pertusa]
MPEPRWYGDTVCCRDFAKRLTEAVPNLQDFELDVYWDKPDEFLLTSSSDAVYPFGSLKSLKDLVGIAVDLGFLIDSSAHDAPSRLLSLPSTVLPDAIEWVIFTNVKLNFLSMIVDEFRKEEPHDVIRQFLAAIPSCGKLIFEAYWEPVPEDLEVLDGICQRRREDGVECWVEWYEPDNVEELREYFHSTNRR